MIVASMTPEEVYRELECDRDNLSRWLCHRINDVKKRALKSTKFPLQTWTEWLSPRKNRYVVSCIVLKRKFSKNNVVGVFALQRTSTGTAAYSCGAENLRPTHDVYLHHMFVRYSQRMGIEKTGIELIRHFVTHNLCGEVSCDKQYVGKSVRYNGKDYMSVCTTEGVLLGEMLPDDIFVAHTFITYDMAKSKQREEFEQKRKSLPNLRDYAKNEFQRI